MVWVPGSESLVTSTPSSERSWRSTASPPSSTWREAWPTCSGTRSTVTGTRGKHILTSEWKWCWFSCLAVKLLDIGVWMSWRLACLEWVTWDRASPRFSQVSDRHFPWSALTSPFCCPELGCDVVGLVSSPRGPTQHVSRPVLSQIVKFDQIPNIFGVLKIWRILNTEYIQFLKTDRILIPNSTIQNMNIEYHY